ncbi:hypothetical protein ACUNG6_11475 [Serratia sp. IR-2025]
MGIFDMKCLFSEFLFLSLLVCSNAKAHEGFDLQCRLDNDEVMMLSHSRDTVYISFESLEHSSDTDGRIIKLDILSGEAKQSLVNNRMGEFSYVLRGIGEDIEGAIAIVYEKNEGVHNAYFSVTNYLGREVEVYVCDPTTLKVDKNLLILAINNVPFL